MTDPLLLTVPQVMVVLGLGRTKVYQLIGQGELPVVHIGRAVRIPRAALDEWVDVQATEAAAAATSWRERFAS